jgi:hypothetical protein
MIALYKVFIPVIERENGPKQAFHQDSHPIGYDCAGIVFFTRMASKAPRLSNLFMH